MSATRIVRMEVRWRDVRPGDMVLDHLGRPMFKVSSVNQARSRHYMVCFGEPQRLPQQATGQSVGGHRDNTVTVEREEVL